MRHSYGYSRSRHCRAGLDTVGRLSGNFTLHAMDIDEGKLAWLRGLGDVGQYIARRLAGYSPAEIMKSRGWSRNHLYAVIEEAGKAITEYQEAEQE